MEDAALGGFCLVEVVDHEAWIKGQPHWAVHYAGQTYFCSGDDQQRRFQANPERYLPGAAGLDLVALVESQAQVPGQIQFPALYEGKLYLFSSSAALARFRLNPAQYASRSHEMAASR